MDYPANFIHDIIEKDIADGVFAHGEIHTRFPPEPNGYLHIGSAKAIRINFTAANRFGGKFNLRYDDTNPEREDDEYVRSIKEDITWLIGTEPTGGVFFGSDVFDKCYEFAMALIEKGAAYVCDLSAEEMREKRGTLTEAGEHSPYRDRSVNQNADLFARMKAGEFPNGHCTLRAKIDMASPNMNMRDPAIYRINHTHHHRQGDKWCIYPLYDYAHPIQDALEGITHSCCSIEFENHRPLYDWVVDNVFGNPARNARPCQFEFARLNMTHTVMSKRYLRELVENGLVDGWDDPRMPTLSGLRRRGYTPTAIGDFLDRAGYSKSQSIVSIEMLEHCMREELNAAALRRVAVIEPLLVTITNMNDGETRVCELPNHPQHPELGTRELPFTRRVYIERSDFSDNPPPKFHRLKLDMEVRLMGAYIIKCNEVIYDDNGTVIELKCTADFENSKERKVKGTIHWVSADACTEISVIQYDRLFTQEEVGDDYEAVLNRESARRIDGVKIEQSLAGVNAGERFQFVRMGYFTPDSKHKNVWNSIVGLKSSFKPK
ncbi:MAG: glutamine--tRNA ligase/YqeY domain fusion protein [Oscillospiraceae bacterium]|nr:glutamine--tRNA ligase/YqeY domain fusion protein [Oscillospiraceae bacterium]